MLTEKKRKFLALKKTFNSKNNYIGIKLKTNINNLDTITDKKV